ncbi:lipoprotein-releasing system ATP-binding protein LolD [Candidatus Dependentiae bacterium Noda2021]|nr:lipoprotein-releasing system ATP-binding protein LolD [Candidatus Dependentiae bacterium Noda2021]
MIAVANLVKTFDQANQTLTVLNGISAEFHKGKSYAIIGPSGSGKSTLLHMLVGIESPTSGSVLFNNQVVNSFTQRQHEEFLNKYIGLVFQASYLIQELTVLENVMVKGLIKPQSLHLIDDAMNLLREVGIAEKADQLPARLSGGQQQRVALARALFNKPLFLLGDEITGNLDFQLATKILDLLIHAQRTWNMGLIITTHDDYVADRMDHVFELKQGTLNKIR